MVHWDAVAAVAAIIQTLLVAGAAVVALVQLRHLNHQNELAAFIQLSAQYNSPEVRRARHFVTDELAQRLRDPIYLREIAEGRTASHPEMLILNYFSQVGHLITSGVLKPEIWVGEYGGIARLIWKHLLPVIALRRKTLPIFAVYFEAFVVSVEAFDAAALSAKLREQTPRPLRSSWDVQRGEIEEVQAEMLARLEAANGGPRGAPPA